MILCQVKNGRDASGKEEGECIGKSILLLKINDRENAEFYEFGCWLDLIPQTLTVSRY